MEPCQWCRRPFEPGDSDARRFATFCSSDCEDEANTQRPLDLVDPGSSAPSIL